LSWDHWLGMRRPLFTRKLNIAGIGGCDRTVCYVLKLALSIGRRVFAAAPAWFRITVVGGFGTPFVCISRRFGKANFAHGILLAALAPQGTGNFEGVEVALLPPLRFLTRRVDLVMMDAAQRYRELIAHLQSEPTRLRVADVVSV
jgi:hypothetical protein